MEDNEIVELYFSRNDRATLATAEKYGGYCMAIAKNILGCSEDAEECVNDTYLRAWNTIPPHQPRELRAFLGKITRNLAFNRYKSARAEKRGGGEIALVLDELSECVSGSEDVNGEIDRKELIKELDLFVSGLSEQKRSIFIRRYWYADSVEDIAKEHKITRAAAAKTLERLRRQLSEYLKERGFDI